MDDTKYGPTASWSTGPSAPDDTATGAETADAPQTSDQPAVSPAVERFQSCRWRATPDTGEFCTHRDVLPFAGKEGFKPESWCPECAFYKLRRTPKKRERDQERSDYYY